MVQDCSTLQQSHCVIVILDCMHICMNNSEPHFHHVKTFSELASMQKSFLGGNFTMSVSMYI